MAYNHGIRVLENATSVAAPITGTAGLQVVFGTAPVNLAEDPEAAVNKPVIAYSFAEAVKQLGYSDDFTKYTLCQSMDASFRVFGVGPVVFINVLDPAKHKKVNTSTSVTVTNMQAVVDVEGILLNTLSVSNASTELVSGIDYIASFNDYGYVVITLLAGGGGAAAATLSVSSTSIDPAMVTETDIIGGYNVSTGAETGIEALRFVYPKFGMTPGLLLAPGWSHKQNVSAVLAAKCKEINGLFQCECLIDLDSSASGAVKYIDCATAKVTSGCSSEHAVLLWPQVLIGSKQYAYSAVFGALVAYTDVKNGDIPNLSPSNKLLNVTAAVLADGTEVSLDQTQANLLNSQGIVTAINMNGWRSWGNNTACYPGNTDPKDRWFCCRRFFSWWRNSFILTYAEKVDNPANFRLIESIVDAENIRGNSYVSQGKCAGARMEYVEAENSVSDILDGKIQFRQYLAPYTPAEDILNSLEFDPDMLARELNGGE